MRKLDGGKDANLAQRTIDDAVGPYLMQPKTMSSREP